MNNPLFFVIEGTDGSGKGTQFELLAKRLVEVGHKVAVFDFPQYDQPSSYFVKEYLNGNFGTAEEVGPYTGSLFYALDRYSAAPRIRQALEQGYIVLANRFTGSNMGHQGTKFADSETRRGYFLWNDNLEFEMLGIPRPTKSFVLRVPAEIAQALVDKKEKRSYTDKKRDLHEADMEHLKKAVDVYDDLCALFSKDFERIDCVRSDELMSIAAIHDMIWKRLSLDLPKVKSGTKGKLKKYESVAENPDKKSDEPLIAKNDNGVTVITEAGKQYLQDAVTDVEGNVYTFTDKMSPITIAAAMARLSRRADDMRITILDEFAEAAAQKDEKLLKRVITAYGDDSVQQLVGQHVVVEGASNLLTKKLEWGRLAAYLEQSTRYIYFDQKDEHGEYRYYTPDHFDESIRAQYKKVMDAIFDVYSKLVHDLTKYVRDNSTVPQAERDVAWQGATRAQACDAIRTVLPVATKSTVGIFASGQALENLIMNLLADDLPEAKATGQKILKECRKVLGTFLERADKPDRGGATIAYRNQTRNAVLELAEKSLSTNLTEAGQAVTLTDVWPRNELDIVPDLLYEHSNLPLTSIRSEVNSWKIEQKSDALLAYIGDRMNRRHRPGRALEKIHYSWDLVCDYGIFRDLQRHRIVDDLEWQQLTPRYGFEIPKLVEDAGLTDLFEQCFALSLALHSFLIEKGYGLEAQYATLLGHKMRWKVTYNAREAFHLHELRTTPQGHPGYRKLVIEMHQKLCEIHPIIGEGMKFVNRDEDPELTRLAAERATQFKLDQL
ncbi:MAG: FAD-dependent thymidylate synthase [bacterium]|nr:FAD-dependent thymidylate synthase [bacterium]